MAEHGRRLNWVREHLSAVLAHFGIGDADGSEVKGMFVVEDEPLIRNAPSRYWDGGAVAGVSARISGTLRTKDRTCLTIGKRRRS